VVVNLIEKIYNEFENLKSVVLDDEIIQDELKEEFNAFCKKLLNHILDAVNPTNMLDRLFVGKLIEYISHSGDSTVVNTRTVKYLLTAFTEVIDCAGDIEDEKERKHTEKTILVFFHI